MATRQATGLNHVTLLLVILLTGWSTTSQADALQPYRAIYAIEKHDSDIARSTQQLRRTRDHLDFTQTTELAGLLSLFRDDRIDEESRISTDSTGWRLKHYELTQRGDSKRRDMHFDVEWHRNDDTGTNHATIKGTYVDENFDAKRRGEVWDPLSVILALQRDQHAGKNEFVYRVVNKGRIKEYRFDRQAQQKVVVDDETHDSVLFTRSNGRRETRIWLSLNNNLIPVRIEQHKDGELDTRMDLVSLER